MKNCYFDLNIKTISFFETVIGGLDSRKYEFVAMSLMVWTLNNCTFQECIMKDLRKNTGIFSNVILNVVLYFLKKTA